MDRQGMHPFGLRVGRVVMKRTTSRQSTFFVGRLSLSAGLLLTAGIAGCGGGPGTSGEPRPPSSQTPSSMLLSMPDGDTREDAVVLIEPGTYRIPAPRGRRRTSPSRVPRAGRCSTATSTTRTMARPLSSTPSGSTSASRMTPKAARRSKPTLGSSSGTADPQTSTSCCFPTAPPA
jgi:hypothetical protein